MFKIFFSVFLFLASGIYSEDIRVTFVQNSLTNLPTWCQSSYLYQKPDISTLSAQIDENGWIRSIALIQGGKKVDEIFCEWEMGTNIRRLKRVHVPQQLLTHTFEYDENDCAHIHRIQGNLTGESTESEQQYQTTTIFTDQHWPCLSIDANGKRTEYYYTEKTRITESDPNTTIKRRFIADEAIEEEIIEDESSFLQNSEVPRRWKKNFASTDGSTTQITILDGMSVGDDDFILRREEYTNEEDGDGPSQIFDAEDHELFPSKKEIDANDETLLMLLGTPDFDQLDDNLLIPASVTYTSRQTPSTITYTNGKQKQLRYFSDGQLQSIVYPNGSKVFFERDSFGRKLKSLYYPHGATEPVQRVYRYEGLSLIEFEDSPGYSYRITKDHFNLPLEFCQFYQGSCIQKVQIICDGLERIISLNASGKYRYQKQYEYGQTCTIFKHVLFQENGMSTCITETFDDSGILLERHIGEISYIFDQSGRIVRIEKNGIPTVMKEYHLQDGLVEETSHFSDKGKLVEVREASGKLTSRTWYDRESTIILKESLIPIDEYGSTQLRQETASKSREIEWHIGANRHLKEIVGPDNRYTTYNYDTHNRLIFQNTRSTCGIHYEYEHDRLVRLCAEDGSLDYRYGYDELGRIVEITDALIHTTVHREFDSFGRLMVDGETDCRCAISQTPSGEIQTIALPDSSQIVYDTVSITRTGGKNWQAPLSSPKKSTSQSTYTFDSMGQLVQEQGNTSCSYSFDPFGKPLKQLLKAAFDGDGNCISMQEAPSTRHFSYDALGRLSRCDYDGHNENYRYDGLSRLTEITTDGVVTKVIRFDNLDLGSISGGKLQELRLIHPRTKELLYLEMRNRHYQVEIDSNDSIVALYGYGRDCISHMYAYTAFGTCIPKADPNTQKPFLSYRFCGKRLLPLANCYDFGPRRLHPELQRWLEADPLGITDTVDDRIFCRNNPTVFRDQTGLFPKIIDFDAYSESLLSSFEQMVSSTYKSLTFAKHHLDWIMEMRTQYETVFFTLVGRTWLQLMGFNLDPTAEEVAGVGDGPKKARITLINGILNGSLEAQRSAHNISKLHGNVPVYYVYSATQGFAGDLLRGTCYKLGVVSKQAKILVNLWRKLIQEMGGPTAGGVIWHYAHSLGATDTANALSFLTPEEKSVIRVATFGSPTILDADACAKVDNYISVNDGVPYLDPIRYVIALRQHQPHVHFLHSNTYPLMDHMFSGNTYREVLNILGQEFQDEFLQSNSIFFQNSNNNSANAA
jgi:RHS repeat-associated protein